METTTLYYREGSSDKVYQASIVPKGDGFAVQFAYGRRGAALKTGTKTDDPLDYAAAKALYEKLIRQKTAKGYTPGEDGTPYRHTDSGERDGGIRPLLPQSVDDEYQVGDLVADPAWCMQQKFDGRRMLVRKEGGEVTAYNRRGLAVGLSETILANVREGVEGDCVLDGEAVGERYHVFDILAVDDRDIRPCSYGHRLEVLEQRLSACKHSGVVGAVETTFVRSSKQSMLESLRRDNAEGVVFKCLAAPYAEGFDGGASQLKYKFYESASFVVAGRNGTKRSVALALLRDGREVPAGNVTIPANHPVPAKGAVVEVRYLYAFPESGSVYQPVYLGERDDIATSECTATQLKYKAEALTA